MAGQYWQPSALSNNPVAYPSIPTYGGYGGGASSGVSGGVAYRTGGGHGQPLNHLGFDYALRNPPASIFTAPPETLGADSSGSYLGRQGDYNRALGNWLNQVQTYNGAVTALGGGGGGNGSAFGPGGMGAGGGGYGGAASGNTGYLKNLIGSFQDAMNRANAANEARYQDALKGYQNRYETGMNQLQGMGAQEGRDINELYDKQRAQQNQNLIGRGLGNSTVQATMNSGNDRERAAALGRLNETVRQQTVGTAAGLSGDELQFIERKQENAPSYGMLAQLAQGLGTAGYGAGGGGYGGGGFVGPPAYDTSGLGYQNPQFGYGSNGGGWSGYGNNGYTPAQLASIARNSQRNAQRGNTAPTGFDPPLVMNGSGTMGSAGGGDFVFNGDPTSASGATFAGANLGDLAVNDPRIWQYGF